MATFKVTGGTPLKGSIRLGGAKNASFKLMIAAALGEGESRLLNMSKIGDVDTTFKTLDSLGAKVSRPGDNTVYIASNGLNADSIPQFSGEKSRASTLFAGILLNKMGRAVIPLPGGCALGGRRIIHKHKGQDALGATIIPNKIGLEMIAPDGLHGATYTFPKKSHTGTESLLLAAVLARGETVIHNAGLEPEIDDMIAFLNKMGGKIARIPDSDSIKITGVTKLHGATHKVMPDRNEAISYACMAIATKGDIIVENACPDHLTAFTSKLDEVGGKYEIADYGMRFWYEKTLRAADLITTPEPGFMTDWQPLWTTMMTQAEGESNIIEAVHNNRLIFTEELNKMGANIKLYDPEVDNPEETYQFEWPEPLHNYHAARVMGPTPLKGARLTVPDLRGGATLVMAAIIADGESIIDDAKDEIDRGYADFDDRLRNLSANIERV